MPKSRINDESDKSSDGVARGSIIAEAILSSVVSTSYFEVMPLISHLHGDEEDEEWTKPHHTQCIRKESDGKWRLEDVSFSTVQSGGSPA